MHRAALATLGVLTIVVGSVPVQRADADWPAVRHTKNIVRHPYRDTRPSCPDDSCGSLYGAYGPYGAAYYQRYYAAPPAYPAACDAVVFPRSPRCPAW